MSQLTFLNTTPYIAQFVVAKGQQIIARPPGLEPQARFTMAANDRFEVAASTLIDGNTYTSAPATIVGNASFLAQIKQDAQQGTYEFEMAVMASTVADQWQFYQTTLGPVTFSISQYDTLLQSVVVERSFDAQTLTIGDTYSFYAVIEGVTTATVTTTNPNAQVTAEMDATTGFFTLAIA
ncbi:hypothetical protein AB4851_26385 [Burkholderia sp. 22PA0099]|uniref:hypothetical protein n=1 Tax=Burkholderia sp. 22PA0099 TaxID=3237372 RepID=UPI0039C12667